VKKARPFLVAETPRAGRWNGCLLVPEDSEITPAKAAPYFEDARKIPEGENYLAVSREVTQPTTGRVGSEYLLLAGVDVRALGPVRKEEVSRVMNKLLDDLEDLVVRTIRWDELPQASLVKCPGMSGWLEKLGHLKPSKDQRPRPVRRRGWSVAAKLKEFVGPLVLLCFCVAAFCSVGWGPLKAWWNDQANAQPITPPGKVGNLEGNKANPHSKTEKDNQALEQEADRWLKDLKLTHSAKDGTPPGPDANVRRLTTELENRFLLRAVLEKRQKQRQESKGEDPRERLHNLLQDVILSDSSSGVPPDERPRRANHELLRLLEQRNDAFKSVGKLYGDLESEEDMHFGFFAQKSDDQSIFPANNVEKFRELSKKAVQLIERMHAYYESKPEPLDDNLKELRRKSIGQENESCQALTSAAKSSWKFYTPDDLQGIDLIGSICGNINEGYHGVKLHPVVGTRNQLEANPEQPSSKAKQLKAVLEDFKSRKENYVNKIETIILKADLPRKEVFAALKELADAIEGYLNSEGTPGSSPTPRP